MRIRPRPLALSLAVAMPLATSGLAAGSGQARSPQRAAGAAYSHLQVVEVEYRLMLSRGVVRAGRVGLEALDRGMDPHDVYLRRVSSGAELSTPLLAAGQRWSGVVTLRPGVYHLWCALPEHARLGMRATLIVR